MQPVGGCPTSFSGVGLLLPSSEDLLRAALPGAVTKIAPAGALLARCNDLRTVGVHLLRGDECVAERKAGDLERIDGDVLECAYERDCVHVVE